MHRQMNIAFRPGLVVIASLALSAGLIVQSNEAAARARPQHSKAAHKSHVRGKQERIVVLKVKPAARAATERATAKIAAAEANPGDESNVSQQVSASAAESVMSRADILAAQAGRLERAGRHIIAGFLRFDELRPLVEKRAIGGIFITDHNVRGLSAADIKNQISALQTIRTGQGLPPLIIAADQEGGTVSRLSPPLKRQPALGQIIAKLPNDAARKAAVTAYAAEQAQELKRIGVTLNFAPVVDLKLTEPGREDGETKLRMRAIGDDPYLVSKVGSWYCDGLAKSGILCTLKHFPGLGRVLRDTHVAFGGVDATEGKLELNDWVPFRRVMQRPNAATMLGHVFVQALDNERPASYSKVIITDLIRDRWQYDGLLITDDFSMGAITGSKSGAGGAAVKSLNAGGDFVLVSYLEEHYDRVMSAILAADENGTLDQDVRAKSRERIKRVLDPTTWAPPE